jgi:hypothetical protein
MTASPTTKALRQCVLAVSVIDDVDLTPRERYVVVDGTPPVRIPWKLVRRAVAGAQPDSPLARARLARWLHSARWIADLDADVLSGLARPYGVAVDHPLHPGLDWVRRRVLGETLDLGLGFAGLNPAKPDDVVPVPHGLLELLKVDATPWWPRATLYLEEMGAVASVRMRNQPNEPLKPMGDCDVVTLLGSGLFRAALCADDATGMRGMAVPMRTRGWFDLARIDPAFAAAAAAATELEDRGFERPLLVTADEVVQAQPGGRPAEIELRDPSASTPHLRDVLYR